MFELYINWHHAIGFKVMSMGRNGSSLACMTGKSHNKQLYVKWLNWSNKFDSWISWQDIEDQLNNVYYVL